eukprot:GCRY01003304.1.p1 GENE.GCRY01003304.1~~GCRY01003304.1.p1  ORF type:complete len:914 (+),score=276.76 GCRY01003304.1:179-2920(+)
MVFELHVQGFLNLILDDDLAFVTSLIKSCDISDADKIAKSLVHIFENENKTLALLKHVIRLEVSSTGSSALLFRANSMASKMMSTYLRLVGLDYVRAALSASIEDILASPSFEVDELRAKEGENLEDNINILTGKVEMFLEAIYSSVDSCPESIRQISSFLKTTVSESFPGSEYIALAGFIFLRFLCSAIVTPTTYQLLPSFPKKEAHRGLVLVAKVLQNIANGVQFSKKEQFMIPMNPTIEKHIDKLKEFLDKLAVPTSEEYAPASVTEPQLLESVTNLQKIVAVHQLKIEESLSDVAGEEKANELNDRLSAILRNFSQIEEKKTQKVGKKNDKEEKEDRSSQEILNSDFQWCCAVRHPCQVAEDLLVRVQRIIDANILVPPKESSTNVDWQAVAASIDFAEFQVDTHELQKVKVLDLCLEDAITFYLNLYNVIVFHLYALQGEPKMSHFKKLFKKYKYMICGVNFSLNDILHGVLRCNPDGQFRGKKDERTKFALEALDPRIHFAIVPGFVKSSPRMRVYKRSTLGPQLRQASFQFLPRHVAVYPEKKKIVLPKLFDTYKTDFGVYKTEVFGLLSDYLSEETTADISALVSTGDYVLQYEDLDLTPASAIFDTKPIDLDSTITPSMIQSESSLVASPVPGCEHLIEPQNPNEPWVLNAEPLFNQPGGPAVEVSLDILSFLLQICKKYLYDWKTIAASVEFETYLEKAAQLQQVHVNILPDLAKQAFFVNVANIIIIHVYCSFGLPDSRSLRNALLKVYKYRVGPVSYSLEDIISGILRGNPDKQFKKKDLRNEFVVSKPDPKVLFLVSFLTKSSAPLRPATPQMLQEDLHEFTKQFLMNRVVVNPEKKKLKLPSLMKDYRHDFGKDPNTLLSWLITHLDAETQVSLAKVEPKKWKIEYEEFSWSLAPQIMV